MAVAVAETPTRYSAFDVAERSIPGGVKAYLTKCRAITDDSERMSDQAIADHLRAWFDIDVTDEAVRQWRQAQGVA